MLSFFSRFLLCLLITFCCVSHCLFAIPLSQKRADDAAAHGNSFKVYETKHCGKVISIRDDRFSSVFPSQHKKHVLSYPDELRKKQKRLFKHNGKRVYFKKMTLDTIDFRTPKAVTFLKIPMEMNEFSKSEAKKFSSTLLLNKINRDIRLVLKKETLSFRSLGIKSINTYVDTIEEILISAEKKSTNAQLKLLVTLYPDVFYDITATENHPYRPLVCQFQLKRHNMKMFQRLSYAIYLPVVGLSIASAVATTGGVAIVPLALVTAASFALLGIKEISFGLARVWQTEKAASVALKSQLIYKECKKLQKWMERSAKQRKLLEHEEKLLKDIKYLLGAIPEKRTKQLKKIANGRHFVRLQLAYGFLNITFTTFNLGLGDPTLIQQLTRIISSFLFPQ